MKFAPMNYHYLHYPIKKPPGETESSPFDSIDLYCSAPQLDIFDYSLNRLIELDRGARQGNLKVMTMTPENCVYPVNLCTQGPVTRQSSVHHYQRAVGTVEFLGYPNTQISTGFDYFDQSREEAWKRCRGSLAQLVMCCQRKQARLLLEELKVTTINVLITSKDIAGMLDEVGSPCIVGMVDMDQMTHVGEAVSDYFDHLGERPMHIHFNDRGHTVPGHGDLFMKEYYDAIKRRGYDGTVSFEICDYRYYHNPDKTIDGITSRIKKNTHELGDVIEETWCVDS